MGLRIMDKTPFGYLSDPRSDKEVADDYVVADKDGLTEEGRIALQKRLKELIIKERERLRKRADVFWDTRDR